MKKGSFTFVLHSHLPYVRKAGRWPHGEEMLHEAMAETYVPLLDALFDLKQEGHAPRLTIGLTPILLEQLADPDVMDHFELYLVEKLALVEADILRHQESGDEQLHGQGQVDLRFDVGAHRHQDRLRASIGQRFTRSLHGSDRSPLPRSGRIAELRASPRAR